MVRIGGWVAASCILSVGMACFLWWQVTSSVKEPLLTCLLYTSFVHESCYSKIDILSAANKLLAELNLPVAESLECALQIFRKLFR